MNGILSAELLHDLGADIGALSLDYRPAILAKCSAQQYERLLPTNGTDAPLREHFLAEAQRLHHAEAAMGQTLFGPQRDDIAITFRGKGIARLRLNRANNGLSFFCWSLLWPSASSASAATGPSCCLTTLFPSSTHANREIVSTFLKTHAFQTFITATEERDQFDGLNSLAHLQVQRLDGQTTLRNGTPHAVSCTH